MERKILADYIKNGDIENAIEIIEKMGSSKKKEYVQILVEQLEETDSHVLRNTIAIALADIGDSSSVNALIRLLVDPKTLGSRGTLLYALESLEYSSHVTTITKLLSSDNFEVSRQSFQLLALVVESLPEQVKSECRKIIVEDLKQVENEWLEEALDLFSGNLSDGYGARNKSVDEQLA